jgi:putative transposase
VEFPPAGNSVVGIEAGITSLVTLSTGEKITNPEHERRDRSRLALAQRRMARKAKGSANREKARLRVARAHARIADRRRDFLHKLTTRLVRENQAVVIEDLNVRGMLGNHCLARAISRAAWGDLRARLEYKCDWYDRDINAAKNILAAGLAVAACGGGVRPKPVSRGGQSPMKQETQRATSGIPRL